MTSRLWNWQWCYTYMVTLLFAEWALYRFIQSYTIYKTFYLHSFHTRCDLTLIFDQGLFEVELWLFVWDVSCQGGEIDHFHIIRHLKISWVLEVLFNKIRFALNRVELCTLKYKSCIKIVRGRVEHFPNKFKTVC